MSEKTILHGMPEQAFATMRKHCQKVIDEPTPAALVYVQPDGLKVALAMEALSVVDAVRALARACSIAMDAMSSTETPDSEKAMTGLVFALLHEVGDSTDEQKERFLTHLREHLFSDSAKELASAMHNVDHATATKH